jgi:hypothetical protein
MIARNINAPQLHAALATANQAYHGNLAFRYIAPQGKGFQFTLTVKSSKGPGGRRGHTGRRVAAACWHAHRDLFKALFDAVPDAKIISCRATYDGRADFERSFEATGDANIGSLFQPLCFRDACDCNA